MTTKKQINPKSAHEPIPDKKTIELRDKLSFIFVDEFGKERIQNIREFREENRPYYEVKQPRSKAELETASTFRMEKRSEFFPFNIPDRVVWDEFQTAIRNQKNRDTCSAFAMVAAIEARYMRDYGLNLNLSEQFFWHSYKSTGLSYPKHYKYENQSSYWGGGNSHGIRRTVNFSIPLEQHCSYKDQNGMRATRDQIPGAGQLVWKRDVIENTVTQDEVDAFEYSRLYIPDDARQNAQYGTKSFILFDSSTIKDTSKLEWLLAWGNEVIVDAHLKWKTDMETGIMEYDSENPGGWHCFLVVGFDRNEKVFYVKNSWGGDNLIRVSYEFARNCFTYGSIVREVTDPKKPVKKGRAIGRWQMNHDGHKGELIIRRFTNENNDVTRLGHYSGPDGSLKAINGQYVHEGRGVQFSRTEGADSNPTSLTGQQFTIDIFGREIQDAAGDTVWNNIRYGSYMSRDTFNSAQGRDFESAKWKGRWSMNHDGWKGTLKISQIESIPLVRDMVLGEYKPANGTPMSVFGFLDRQHPHILNLYVSFSSEDNRHFVLHFHTWSSDLASGYTFWNGRRFGAVAFKK